MLFFQGVIFAQSFAAREFDFIDMDDGFPSNEIYHCYEDDRGVLWFATDNGVVRYNGNEIKIYSVKEGLDMPVVFWFYELNDGSLFAESYLGYYFCIRNDKITPYEFNDTLAKYFGPKNFGYSFHQDKQGNRYFGNKEGFLVLDSNGNVLENVVPNAGKNSETILSFTLKGDDFISYRTKAPVENEKYNLRWVQGEDTIKYWIDFTEKSGISTRGERVGSNWVFNLNKCVLLLTSDGDLKSFEQPFMPIMINNVGGQVFVSTVKGGTYIYDIIDEELVLKDSAFAGLSVSTVMQTADSLLWVGTIEKGVAKEVHTNLRIAYQRKRASYIRAYQRTDDYELIGFEDGKLIKKENGEEQEYQFPSVMYDVVNLAKDTAFVMTPYGGCLDLKTGKLITIPGGEPSGEDTYFFNLGRLSETYFVGSYIDELNVFKREKGRLEFITKLAVSNRILDFEIFNEYLYVGHTDGVSIFNIQNSALIHEVKEFGIINSVGRMNDLIVGTDNKGNMIIFSDPLHYQTFKLPENKRMSPQTFFIEDQTIVSLYNVGVHRWDLSLGGVKQADFFGIPAFVFKTANYQNFIYLISAETVYAIPKTGVGKTTPKIYLKSAEVNKDSVNFNKEIILDYNANNLKFTFESVGYLSDKHLFRYRLKNHDLDFIYTKEQQAYYSALPSGEYTFEVQSTMDGYFYSDSVNIDFIIRTPYWQKTWFYLSLGLIFIGLVSFVYTHRIRRLKRLNKLTLSVSEMRAQALTGQLNPHLVFNILNAIQGMIARSDREQANDALADFARYLRKALDLSKRSTVSMNTEIEVTRQYIDLELIRFPNGLKITLNEISDLDVRVPPLLIQPLIENAIKHGVMPLKGGRGGEIQINVVSAVDQIEIKVTDNGNGVIDETALFKGDGLRIVRERIKNLNPKNELTYNRINNISIFIITICI